MVQSQSLHCLAAKFLVRTIPAIIVLLLGGANSAFGDPPPDPNEWQPDPQTVASIDAKAIVFEIPSEFGPVAQYSRFYWGTVENGRRIIEGIFVTNHVSVIADVTKKASEKSRTIDGTSGLAHIVAEKDAPAFADGGCMFVYVRFDLDANKITSERCNFELRPPPPPPSH